MDNYLKQTDEFDLELDLNQNSLFVLTNVQYSWINDPFTSAWTESEKTQLQNQTNRLIWNSWNNLISLQSSDKSFFSKKKTESNISVIFISQSTSSTPHWTIEISKKQKGDSLQTNIQWSLRKINISIEDSANSQSGRRDNSYAQTGFSSTDSGNIDSYWAVHKEEFSNANQINGYSIGNLGTQLRERYINLLPEIINDRKNPLVPKTVFTIK